MVPFDQLGEVVSTIAEGVEDAFGAIGDFLSEPLTFGGSADLPQAMGLPQIVEDIKNGRSEDWHQGTRGAHDLATAHQKASDDIGRMLTALRASWTGQGADSADARIDKFRAVTNAAAERFTANADNLGATADGFDYVQHHLEPMPPKPPEKDFWDEITPWNTDVEDAIESYNATANRNLELYSRYAADTGASASGLNGDYGVLGAYDGKDFTMRHGPSGPHGPTGHGGPEPVVKHPGQPGPSEPGHGKPGPGAPGPAGPPVSPGTGGDGAGRVPPPTGGAGGTPVGGGHPAEEGTTTAGYVPPEIPDGTRSAVPPGSTPSMSTGTSTGIGFGMPGTTAAPGSTARGGANGGTGHAPGARSGGTAVEPGATGSRSATAGGRGAKGAPEGGIVPGGGRGKDDDREHHRKYGLPDTIAETDDEAENATDPVTGLPVMPPTIGA
ncbi:WXG100 family type VII secretion target [Amycolatopsis sp. CA-230715]|uniref:WXG100 family type VII secretion target n=1 Tax=Amycolatopsis sp. CA-230715 TaxID=2745196 RepID=UPI001C01C88B|nr:hypothetical protein [Amycolatopsis sp. CA-230715]QWF83724.1 hypothetical protein HUW46_07167 [Amycolatopsis sp. CA-230715]